MFRLIEVDQITRLVKKMVPEPYNKLALYIHVMQCFLTWITLPPTWKHFQSAGLGLIGKCSTWAQDQGSVAHITVTGHVSPKGVRAAWSWNSDPKVVEIFRWFVRFSVIAQFRARFLERKFRLCKLGMCRVKEWPLPLLQEAQVMNRHSFQWKKKKH